MKSNKLIRWILGSKILGSPGGSVDVDRTRWLANSLMLSAARKQKVVGYFVHDSFLNEVGDDSVTSIFGEVYLQRNDCFWTIVFEGENVVRRFQFRNLDTAESSNQLADIDHLLVCFGGANLGAIEFNSLLKSERMEGWNSEATAKSIAICTLAGNNEFASDLKSTINNFANSMDTEIELFPIDRDHLSEGIQMILSYFSIGTYQNYGV